MKQLAVVLFTLLSIIICSCSNNVEPADNTPTDPKNYTGYNLQFQSGQVGVVIYRTYYNVDDLHHDSVGFRLTIHLDNRTGAPVVFNNQIAISLRAHTLADTNSIIYTKSYNIGDSDWPFFFNKEGVVNSTDRTYGIIGIPSIDLGIEKDMTHLAGTVEIQITLISGDEKKILTAYANYDFTQAQ